MKPTQRNESVLDTTLLVFNQRKSFLGRLVEYFKNLFCGKPDDAD